MATPSALLCVWLAGTPLVAEPGAAEASSAASGPSDADLLAEADELRRRSESEHAAPILNRAVELYRTSIERSGNDVQQSARAWSGLGESLAGLGQHREALEAFERARAEWQRAGDARMYARAVVRVGEEQGDLGDNAAALATVSRGLELERAVGDPLGVANALNQLGQLRSRSGATEQALVAYGEALSLRESAGERVLAANVRNNIAAIHSSRGEYRQAIVEYERCLEVFREEGAGRTEAAVLHNLGRAYIDAGESERALELLTASRLRAEALGDRRLVAHALNGTAIAAAVLGRYRDALSALEQALPVFEELGDASGRMSALINLGERYVSLENWSQALARFEEALALARRQGEKRHEAWARYGSGVVYAALGRRDEARAAFEAARVLAAAAKAADLEARILTHLGEVLRAERAFVEARIALDAALALYEQAPHPAGQALAWERLGRLDFDLGDMAQAATRLERAALGYRQAGDRAGETEALYSLARAEERLGHKPAALQHVQQALAIVESLRGAVPGPELRVSYFASRQDLYELTIDLLARSPRAAPDDAAPAFEVSERARARALLDALLGGRASTYGGAGALRAQEQAARERLNAAERQRMELLRKGREAVELERSERRIQELVDLLRETRRRIWEADPRAVSLHTPSLTLDDVRRLVLDEDTSLFEYALGTERSYLFVATLSELQVFELPGRLAIEEAARSMRQLVHARGERVPFETAVRRRARIAAADRAGPAAAAALTRLILPPEAYALARPRLLIVPHGALQYVPFAALPAPGASGAQAPPLVAAHEIVTAPSASVLVALRRNAAARRVPPRELMVFADPVFEPDDARVTGRPAQPSPPQPAADDVHRLASLFSVAGLPRLPASRDEADAILALVPRAQGRRLLGFDATRAAALSAEPAGYRIVHFATHGFVHSEHPEMSGLVLSLVDQHGRARDGFLRLHDVATLELNADLVVLNACQTALGKDVRGEGVIGLAGGFLAAGAQAVLASLWSGSDRESAVAVVAFYRALLRQRRSPSASLRAAQLEVRARRPEPYYWAGLTLEGEWR